MMKWLNGFIIGAVIVGAVGFGLGYNHGRGAPLLTNPFAKYSLEDRLRDAANELSEETRRQLDRSDY